MKNKKIRKYYSDYEIDIIKKYYPTYDWGKLLQMLPDRDKKSIEAKASKLGIHRGKVVLSEENIKEELSLHGFYLLSEFDNSQNKYELIDKDGYKFYSTIKSIIKYNKKPEAISPHNKYAIYNINRYIELNNIGTRLLSTKYINNMTILSWQCKCGNLFKQNWANFRVSSHMCKDCNKKHVLAEKGSGVNDIKTKISEIGYTLIENSFNYIKDGFSAYTKEGYKVRITRWTINNLAKPEIFSNKNPHTIYNIHKYLELNTIDTKLLSTEYINSSALLKWECKCGKIFYRDWTHFYSGATICKECSIKQSGNNKRIDVEEILNILNSKGFKPIEDLYNRERSINDGTIDVIDNEGYKYNIWLINIKDNKTPNKFYPTNKFSIENINRFLKLERKGDYICISSTYKAASTPLKFKHLECGTVFETTIAGMRGRNGKNDKNKYFTYCPKCNTNKTESIHASILKQIFLHEYPDTILEDKTCINPKTKYPLPTDIVNHRLKIAVEIQSAYHDTESRKEIDIFKRNFWTDKGYSFFNPDIRDYTILEMINLFFDNIIEIPTYVNYNFSDCIDFFVYSRIIR